MKINIGRRTINNKSATYIIAEIAGNHNGKLNQAINMIKQAKDAGADAVKFQLFQADRILLPSLPNLKSTYEYFKKTELPHIWIEKLFLFAQEVKIDFLCTPFFPEAVLFLDKLGVVVFKIASGDLTNTQLLTIAAQTKKPILLSTGMSNIREIQNAIRIIRNENNQKIILLHCNSTYPTSIIGANLKAIQTLKQKFKLITGWSDHTPGIGIPVAAVTLGAKVIEKHVTTNRSLSGMDHHFALEFSEFKQMVTQIRIVETALGDGQKKPTREEIPERKWARRAVHPIIDIARGTVINKSMIDALRPNIGISAIDYYKVIGRKVKKNIKAKSNLYWKDLH
jgi:sialic acid synthase SpsE